MSAMVSQAEPLDLSMPRKRIKLNLPSSLTTPSPQSRKSSVVSDESFEGEEPQRAFDGKPDPPLKPFTELPPVFSHGILPYPPHPIYPWFPLGAVHPYYPNPCMMYLPPVAGWNADPAAFRLPPTLRKPVPVRQTPLKYKNLQNLNALKTFRFGDVGLRTEPRQKEAPSDSEYNCDICKANFSHISLIKRHMKGHVHGDNSTFQCEECGRTFLYQKYLNQHMKVMHSDDKKFECTFCAKKFAWNAALKKHLKRHTGEKPFTCEVCNAKFAERYNLRGHMRIHTGERPFSCPHCDARFIQKGNLDCHIRTHSGEKPFRCMICSRGFTQMNNLREHFRTHSAEKPFHCTSCHSCFKYQVTLQRHVRKGLCTTTGEEA